MKRTSTTLAAMFAVAMFGAPAMLMTGCEPEDWEPTREMETERTTPEHETQPAPQTEPVQPDPAQPGATEPGVEDPMGAPAERDQQFDDPQLDDQQQLDDRGQLDDQQY